MFVLIRKADHDPTVLCRIYDAADQKSETVTHFVCAGSVLHELGHCFDLGHTAEGIMARGFDDLDLFFTLSPTRWVI